MTEIGAMIRSRRNDVGLTLQQVAERIGCRRSYLSMIETGQRPTPGEDWLTLLEQVLMLEPDQLVSAARWAATPVEVQHRLEKLEADQRRSDALAAKLRASGGDLDELLSSGELGRFIEQHTSNIERPRPLRFQVPIINKVAAGYPQHFTDLDYPARVADEYLPCPEISDSQSFAARIVGDSMEPQYHEGDIVVFSPDRPTPDGSDCFVRLEPDQETTFKRVFFEGADSSRIRLQPLNGAYPARTVDREQVAGMYAALYVMRDVRP